MAKFSRYNNPAKKKVRRRVPEWEREMIKAQTYDTLGYKWHTDKDGKVAPGQTDRPISNKSVRSEGTRETKKSEYRAEYAGWGNAGDLLCIYMKQGNEYGYQYVSYSPEAEQELMNGADPLIDGWEDGFGNPVCWQNREVVKSRSVKKKPAVRKKPLVKPKTRRG